MECLINLVDVTAGYTQKNPILVDLNLKIAHGEKIAILGKNGAGKSTVGKAVMQMLPFMQGSVIYNGELINNKKTKDLVHMGLAYFMQGGRVFPHLNIRENLTLAGINLGKDETRKRYEYLAEFFPVLKTPYQLNRQTGYLSGGDRHQLSLAMVLMASPELKLLIIDEPSAGLSPVNVEQMYAVLTALHKEMKFSVLLIEQNKKFASIFADKILNLQNGNLIFKSESNYHT